MRTRSLTALSVILAPISLCIPVVASAIPAEVILMRHGEKVNRYALSVTGQERAKALAQQYLGKHASRGLLTGKQKPAALMTITLHTIETMTPTAQSWGLPETAFTVVPEPDENKAKKIAKENACTQEAAHDILTNPRYDNKIVIIMWEHKHIANLKLERKFPGQEVTFRQLLHLGQLKVVPQTWPKTIYDYIWVIKYTKDDFMPTSFTMKREVFTGNYARLPANLWGHHE